MKNLPSLKSVKILISMMFLSLFLSNCNSSTNSSSNIATDQDTSNWYKNKEWLNGLKINPNESINQEEFSRQYHLNKTWWNEAFNFMKTQNLDTLSPGTYVVDSGNVIATISHVAPKDKNQVGFEEHHNFNDLQYVISGKAQMGIAPMGDPGAKVTAPYADSTDTEKFSVTSGDKYYTADQQSFFIFSPKEIHRPAFKLDSYDTIKKIVIKVRVPK
jgi:biofilm protein TabA